MASAEKQQHPRIPSHPIRTRNDLLRTATGRGYHVRIYYFASVIEGKEHALGQHQIERRYWLVRVCRLQTGCKHFARRCSTLT